jgi:phosphatidylserine/phosphatidylglycerophosphate/cardiolipin synthase-like enzyme
VPLTTLRISMFAWNGKRGRDLARRVVRLADKGCSVQIVLGEGIGANVRSILEDAAPEVDVVDATAKNGHGRIFTHQKVFTVSGYYGRRSDATLVWTGSHNWSNGALRRDDLLLRINDPVIFARYRRNFDAIRALG